MKDLKTNFLRLFNFIWPFTLLVLVICVFFWKVVFLKQVPIPGDFVVGVYYPWLDYKWGYSVGVPVKNPITTDVVSFTYPMQMLAIDMIKAGQLPLWNPYILAGTPLLANFQSAPFSPTNFVYFMFDKLSAWSIQIILQHVLAAFFTYLLLRHWRVSKIGAVFGGIIYAFSGFNLIWSQWNGHTLAAGFIPLIILFTDRWLVNLRYLDGVCISLFLALLFLSGYPQVALYLLLAISILWLVRIFNVKRKIFAILFLGLFLFLGLGLSSFQILPGAELLKYSQREVEPLPYEWAFLPWSKVITFVAPDFFGNHATKNYWGPQDYTSNTGFVGVIALVLATIGLSLITAFKKTPDFQSGDELNADMSSSLRGNSTLKSGEDVIKKQKEVFFCFLLLLVSLLFAFPTPISLFLWRSGFLGLNAASAHRALVLFNLSIALTAGFGIDVFLKEKSGLLKSIIFPLIVIFSFGLYALVLYKFSPIIKGFPAYLVGLRNLIFPSGILIVVFVILLPVKKLVLKWRKVLLIPLFLIMVFELFRFGWKFTPFSARNIIFPTTPVLEFLNSREKPFRTTGSRVIPVNMRMPYKIESLEGYDAVYPLTTSQFIAAVDSNRSGTDPVGRYGTINNILSPLVNLANTKYVLVLKRNIKGDPDAKGLVPELFKNGNFVEVFEAKTVVVLENKLSLPRSFVVFDWENKKESKDIINSLLAPGFPLRSKIIVENFDQTPSKYSDGVSKVSYKKYSETESILEVKSNHEGLLFISETWYPGWHAYLDGSETNIYRSDFTFRSIKIPQGTHEVRFIYKPDSFFNGSKIALISAFLLVVISISLSVYSKKLQ